MENAWSTMLKEGVGQSHLNFYTHCSAHLHSRVFNLRRQVQEPALRARFSWQPSEW